MKTQRHLHHVLPAGLILFLGTLLPGAAPANEAALDLSEYRTVKTAITAKLHAQAPTMVPVGQSGYLGVETQTSSAGQLRIAAIDPDSPAAKAGVRVDDILLALNGEPLDKPDTLREKLLALPPGTGVQLKLERKGKFIEATAALTALSRPRQISSERPVLGLRVMEAKSGEGLVVNFVTKETPAESAGVKSGDIVLKLDETPLVVPSDLTDALSEHVPGDTVSLLLQRRGNEKTLRVKLAADPNAETGYYMRTLTNLWKQSAYRVAVVPVEFPDIKHNPKISTTAWSDSFFSRGTYSHKSNATGQAVFGSVNDYYRELSCGALRIEGKVFNWVTAGKKRDEYLPGTSHFQKTNFLCGALDTLLAREGTNALANFDGITFIFAGERVPNVSRGSIYWPHRGSVNFHGKRLSYLICPEGGNRMNNISVFCHEFGHMLGLPDLYARPENPGSEGLGQWCTMSNQRGDGQPQHFSAWCKEQLGWLKPVVLDPTVKQKLLLGPVENSTNECYKVLLRADGTEYFLLENRRKTGFDAGLPAEGLLVWRVVQNRPILEESHGVEGPSGPRVFLRSVPFPSPANNAFTPYTTPSSHAQLGGGLPVFLNDIRQLPDGRIAFHIGYQFE